MDNNELEKINALRIRVEYLEKRLSDVSQFIEFRFTQAFDQGNRLEGKLSKLEAVTPEFYQKFWSISRRTYFNKLKSGGIKKNEDGTVALFYGS